MPTTDPGAGGPERLRDALHRDAEGAPPSSIDLDAVLARSGSARRRRRAALIGGAAGALVIVAAGGLALGGLLGVGPASTTADAPASSESGEAERAPDASAASGGVAPADQAPFASDFAGTPIDRLNPCGAEPVAAGLAVESGLELRVEAPTAVAPGARATAVVTLTNTSGVAYAGVLVSGPALTISDSVTVWHTSGLEAVRTPIELAPGASTSFEAELVAAHCEPADEVAPALPDDLPALAPGEYRLSAAISLGGDAQPLGTPLVSPEDALAVR